MEGRLGMPSRQADLRLEEARHDGDTEAAGICEATHHGDKEESEVPMMVSRYANSPMLRQHYMQAVADSVGQRNFLALAENRTDEVVRTLEKLNGLYFITVSSLHSVAQATMVDAMSQMRGTKYFRHRTKQLAKEAMKKYDEWEKHMREKLKDRYQYWLDLSDMVYEQVQDDIETLRLKLEKVLEANNEKDSGLKSYVLCSMLLTDLAASALGRFTNEVRERTGINIEPLFPEQTVSFKPIHRLWAEACGPMLNIENDEDVNLNDIQEVDAAIKTIQKKIYNPEIYNKAGEYCLKLNLPEDLQGKIRSLEPDAPESTFISDMGDRTEDSAEATRETETNNKEILDRMKIYYEAKARYVMHEPDGSSKTTERIFMVEAETLTEVENIIVDTMTGEDVGGLRITSCCATKIAEACGDMESEVWFKVKVTIPEEVEGKKGKRVKHNPFYYIVGCRHVNDVEEIVSRRMEQRKIAEYELKSSLLTKVTEVIERRK